MNKRFSINFRLSDSSIASGVPNKFHSRKVQSPNDNCRQFWMGDGRSFRKQLISVQFLFAQNEASARIWKRIRQLQRVHRWFHSSLIPARTARNSLSTIIETFPHEFFAVSITDLADRRRTFNNAISYIISLPWPQSIQELWIVSDKGYKIYYW